MMNRICIWALLMLLPMQVLSQSRKQLESKRKKVQAEINYTRQILKKTSAKKSATLHKIGALNEIISQQGQVISGLRTEITRADSEIYKQSVTLGELKAAYDLEKKKLRKTILQAYKTRKTANELAFVFASGTFKQALRRLKYLKRLSDFRQEQIMAIREKAGHVEKGLATLEEIRTEKSSLLGTEVNERRQLENDRAEKARLVSSLAGQEAELRKKIKQNEKAVARLNSAISSMIAREIAAARRKAQKQAAAAGKTAGTGKTGGKAGSGTARSSPAITLTPEARTLSNSFASSRGALPWPVERGYISQGFGVHAHPDLAGITLVNNGVDITTGEGGQARSVFSGTVSAILEIPGQEKAVLINHGEYYTVYSRLSQVYVSQGQKVDARQSLGRVWTDDDNKTILQFQVWQGQAKQNPAGWLAPR